VKIVGKKRTSKASKKATTLSIIPINDLRMIHLEERLNDMIRAKKKNNLIRIMM